MRTWISKFGLIHPSFFSLSLKSVRAARAIWQRGKTKTVRGNEEIDLFGLILYQCMDE